MKKNIAVIFALFLFCVFSVFARPKVALVLSGGGAKGYVHLATLKAIEDYKIPVDYVIGTSMGAVVGGLYASGYSYSDIMDALNKYNVASSIFYLRGKSEIPNSNYDSDIDINLAFSFGDHLLSGSTAFLNDTKIMGLFNHLLANAQGVDDFNNLPRSFRAVAVDSLTGDTVVLKKGSIVEAIRASMGVPLAYKPFEIDGKFLMDGGVNNNVPVDVALEEFNPDIIITSDCTGYIYKHEQNEDLASRLENEDAGPFSVLGQISSVANTKKYNTEKIKNLSDIAIFYDTKNFDSFSFKKFREIIEEAHSQIKNLSNDFENLYSSKFALNNFEEDDGKKMKYSDIQPKIIDEIKVTGNEKYFIGISDYIKSNLESFKGQPFDENVSDIIYENVLEFSEFYNTTGMYFKLNIKPDNTNQLEVKYSFPTLSKHNLGVGFDVALSVDKDFGSNIGARFNTLFGAKIKYDFLIDPKNSLDSINLSFTTSKSFRENIIEASYSKFINLGNRFMFIPTPYISLFSENNREDQLYISTLFTEQNYGAKIGFKSRITNTDFLFAFNADLKYSYFPKKIIEYDQRKHSLLPEIDILLKIGNVLKNKVVTDSGYGFNLGAGIGFDLDIFKQTDVYKLPTTKIPYYLYSELRGSLRVHKNVVLQADVQFGFSRFPYDMRTSYYDLGSFMGIPGFKRYTYSTDFYLAGVTLIVPIVNTNLITVPMFAFRFTIGQHSEYKINLINQQPYDEVQKLPFAELYPLNYAIGGYFIVKTNVATISINAGYEITEKKFMVGVDLL